MVKVIGKGRGEGRGGKVEGTGKWRRRWEVGRLKGKKQKPKGKGDERVEGGRSK